jgi:hypothetical protein
MNRNFAEYATSTAFSIQLSKNQCNALLRCESFDPKKHKGAEWRDGPMYLLQVGTLKPLEARGLVFWHRDSQGRANGFGGLTGAGMLMVGLLKEAGLTVENTNTISMLRRMQREVE